MKRKTVLSLWLALPLLALAFHMGPGQQLVACDAAAANAAEARGLVSGNDYPGAVEAFDAALAALPAERVDEARRLRLERAKARMLSAELPLAREELVGLLDELSSSPDRALVQDVRQALANSQFYTAWLMRLEGRPRAQWEPEVEASRQHYRVLAEAAADAPTRAARAADVEAVVQLARRDLDDLQGLPLPNQ